MVTVKWKNVLFSTSISFYKVSTGSFVRRSRIVEKKSEDNGAGGWGVVLKSCVTCEINIFIRVILRKCFSRPLYGDIQFLLLALRQKIHIYRISLGQLKHYNYD